MTARSERSLIDGLSNLGAWLDPELRAEAREAWQHEQLQRHDNGARRAVGGRSFRQSSSAVPATRKAARRLDRSY